MMLAAQPHDLQWLRIVGVVHLGTMIAATDARLPLYLSALQIDFCIRPTVCLLTLLRMKFTVALTMGSGIFIAVGFTVGMADGPRLIAVTAQPASVPM